MIEAYEVGVSLVMSDSILESISLVNSKFLDAQQIIMGGNAALKRMGTLTSGLIGPTNALASAWKSVAASAAAASAAADRMNGPQVVGTTQQAQAARLSAAVVRRVHSRLLGLLPIRPPLCRLTQPICPL